MPRSGEQAGRRHGWAVTETVSLMSKWRNDPPSTQQPQTRDAYPILGETGDSAERRDAIVLRIPIKGLTKAHPPCGVPECFTGPRAAGSFTAACSYACMCVCDSCLLMYRKKTRTYFRALSALAVAMASSDPDAWLAAVEEATCVLSDFDSHTVLACGLSCAGRCESVEGYTAL